MKRWLIAAAALAAIALLVLLCFYNPQEVWWFPKCPFHLLTGLDCPGCGNQRAVYQLLHGDIAAAVRYNAFLLLALPYLLIVAACSLFRLPRLRRFAYHPATVWTFIGLTIAWWIIRNICLQI